MMPFSTHLLSTTRNHRNSSNNITSSSRLVQHLLLGSCLLLLISGSSSQARLLNRRDLPLSMDKEMFPLFTFQAQDFDEEAPICMAEREPCGFYSFSLDGKAPLKWIKSWCRCTAKQECVYERTDMRMRVYRQTCVPKEVDEAISEEQQQQQQHERSLTSSASQPVEFQQQQPAAAEEDQQQLRDLDSSSLAAPVSSRHHHHHHHHHHNRHIRKANRRIIRRLRAILVD